MADWMARLPDSVKKKPICRICIPGSHDSGAHWFNMRLGYAHDQSFLRYIRHIGFAFIKRIVKRWGLTQFLSLEEQLLNGIRFFDLRLEVALDTRYNIRSGVTEGSNDNSTRKSCFIVHGLYSTDWLKSVTHIVKFLDEHKEEVLIINVSHTYRMTDEDFKRYFLQPLAVHAARCGIKLCDTHEDIRTITLEEMVAKNFRILVIGPTNDDVEDICYRSSAIRSKWPNKNSTAEIIKFAQAEIHAPVSPGLRVLQGVITPKLSDIIRNMRSSLRVVYSLPMRSLLKIWVRRLDAEEIGNLNILITDQVDNEFIRLVYFLNVHDCPEHQLDQYFSNPHLDGYASQQQINIVENILCRDYNQFEKPALIEKDDDNKINDKEIKEPNSLLKVDKDKPVLEQILNALDEDERRISEPEIHVEEVFGDYDVESSYAQPKVPHLRSVMVQQIEMVLDTDASSESASTVPHSPIPPPKPKRASQRIPIVMEVVPLPDDIPPYTPSVSICRSSGTPVRIAPPVTEEELRLAALGKYHTYGSIIMQRQRGESSTQQTIVEEVRVTGVEGDEDSADESTPLVSHEIDSMVEDLVINSTIDAMDNLADRFKSY